MEELGNNLLFVRERVEELFSATTLEFAPFAISVLLVLLVFLLWGIQNLRGAGLLSILFGALIVFFLFVIALLTLPIDRLDHPARICLTSDGSGDCLEFACQEDDDCPGLAIACIAAGADGEAPDPMSAKRISLRDENDWAVKGFGFGPWSNKSCSASGSGWYAEQPGCGTGNTSGMRGCAYMVVRPVKWRLLR